MTKEYSIIWMPFSSNSDLGKHLGTKEDFSLSYFIDGDDKKRFEEGTLDHLSEIHLLRGLLVGYFDNPPTLDIDYSRTLFKYVIEDLRKHFEFQTTEQLVLDVAYFIRQENGDFASQIALRTGLELIPSSSKIRFDLCGDLYNKLERDEYNNTEEGLHLLSENIAKINTNDIRPEFIEHLQMFQDFVINKSGSKN
jgi:hypothetical protein